MTLLTVKKFCIQNVYGAVPLQKLTVAQWHKNLNFM